MVQLAVGPGICVLGDPAASHLILPDARGVVWGHLFDRHGSTRVTALDRREIAVPSDLFVERYWGGYVAIRDLGDRIEVLRDPSGMVSCYYAEIDGAHLLTTRPNLLFDHGLLKPEIDWTIVAQSLVYRDLRPAQTALRGVSELLPGIVLEIRDDQARSSCAWSPWRFADPASQMKDASSAITELRRVATSTLGAWADCFERPLLEISGGLDSAIVAAGLRTGRSGLDCLTFGPVTGEASELPWARAVAEHLAFPLTEIVADAATIDIGQSDAQALPRPCARAFAQALDRPIQVHGRSIGADAFLGGGGGDSMFCLLHSALPVIDRYKHEGLSKGLFETAADIAQLTRTNIWTVLSAAIRRSWQPGSPMPRPMTNAFVARHVSQGLPWPAGNPWLAAPPGISPGKRRHVWSIVGIQNHLEGFGRETIAPFLAPLMSQPIFETCLTIPSWLWCAGGNNRAVAREAFRDALPAAVIDRRTKVSFNSLAYRMIKANLPALRAMLLEGSIAREGLLDVERVTAFLNGTFADGDALPELMALVEVEAWVRYWEGRSLCAPG
ncbi:asparagine synthase-related protein [Sphingomonas sp. G-3-2-10]|uniref:asparagine synthase-related protein n=1 Tax=Sphingomonas sp. G-3-2-10 TaxID=2728838 RepID=UPI001469FFFF|nr:asparagine synthase-related protein [Sphingomonas sp. G-3-2-10]NML06730.1 hypothetical protein [Sphingomonas sp. G-3-2-10]